MKIRFLGGCREVGRSAFIVEAGGKRILLDYGVLMDREVGFPAHISPRELDAIILTHAHLDHSGATPIFYIRGRMPIYGVEPTFSLTELLIKDFLHLSGYYLPYEYIDVRTMLGHCVGRSYRSRFSIGEVEVELLNAGHIPGSCQVLIEADGRRFLYTSDLNKTATRLLEHADTDYGDLDAIMIEGTYANEDHSDRLKLEEEFIANASEVVERGGVALVPAFGVGRSQEVLLILEAHHFQHPVFVDGMALSAIEIMKKHSGSLRDPDLFMRAIRNADWVGRWQDRRKAVKTPSVIVSPAGMLKGGAAIFYMESIADKKQNAILLVSYQVPGTPGRVLLEKKKFTLRGKVRDVAADVGRYDFSSHCGRNELMDTLSALDGKTKVFVVHGAEGNCESLSGWASDELGLSAVAPKPGEEHVI